MTNPSPKKRTSARPAEASVEATHRQKPKLTLLARNLRKKDSWAEKIMWSWLRNGRFSGYKFRRQYLVEPYILDFFCAEAALNVEVDGFQHGFPEALEKDPKRDAFLAKAKKGIRVLRFWCSQLKREEEAVRNTIWLSLHERSPHPIPKSWRSLVECSGDSAESSLSPSPQPSPAGRGSAGERVLLCDASPEQPQFRKLS